MNFLIIEDEIKTAKSLARIIHNIRPKFRIVSILQSVEAVVNWLQHEEMPDLIFMDIQLADGKCFKIFEDTEINVPVVFCTAYSNYTFEAFKNNGIDYILKPFKEDDIEQALKKVEQFQNYFQHKSQSELLEIIMKVSALGKTKTNFLIFSQNKYLNIPTDEISYFYKNAEGIFINTVHNNSYLIKDTLDEIQRQLNTQDFFRVNRQYLIAFNSIKEVQHYFNRRLLLLLRNVETGEKILVSREKATVFIDWLANR